MAYTVFFSLINQDWVAPNFLEAVAVCDYGNRAPLPPTRGGISVPPRNGITIA